MSKWFYLFLIVATVMAVIVIAADFKFFFASKKKPMPYTGLTSKEMLSIISEEGYRPSLDEDEDIVFKDKGLTIFYGTRTSKDLVFGRIYCNLGKDDKWPALLAAKDVETEYIAVKVLVDDESVIFSVEALYMPSEVFRLFFNRTLSILHDSVDMFSDKFHEYKASEESKGRMLQSALVLSTASRLAN